MNSGLTLDELEEVADIQYICADFDIEISIKDYLKELLCKLWMEADDFSSKRPFGNGDWQSGIYEVLVETGYVKGTYEDQILEISEEDIKYADKIILDIILEVM